MTATIRMGVLGAAKVAPSALVTPARGSSEVTVTAVAAREVTRAQRFADRHGIPRVLPSYEALLADPDVDAVYISVPAALRGRWTLAALAAGKHVLCEKPSAANAEEAQQVADAAAGGDLVVMEAFHYRYHPLFDQVRTVLAEGAIGDVTDISARFHAPSLRRKDIRYDVGLGGGALMDLGYYCVHLLRTLTGAEPRVVDAHARTGDGAGLEVALRARLAFLDGTTGSFSCDMRSLRLVPTVRITGTRGELRVYNFVVPQLGHRLVLRTDAGRSRSSVPQRPTSYERQLTAFAGAVLRQEPYPTTAVDAVATMRVVDACYRAARLAPRQPLPR